jgi:hypothetical protein
MEVLLVPVNDFLRSGCLPLLERNTEVLLLGSQQGLKLFGVVEIGPQGRLLQESVQVHLPLAVHLLLVLQQRFFTGRTGDQTARLRLHHRDTHLVEFVEPSPQTHLAVFVLPDD